MPSPISVLREIPNNGFAPSNESISKHLTEQAGWIVEGAYGDVRTVVMLIETEDGVLLRRAMGQPCDRARVIGLLTAAATRASIGDDED